jgi:hypothetical protein
MAELLGAIEMQKGLFLGLLRQRTIGQSRGLHLHSFRDRLRAGGGPHFLQELLALPPPEPEPVAADSPVPEGQPPAQPAEPAAAAT